MHIFLSFTSIFILFIYLSIHFVSFLFFCLFVLFVLFVYPFAMNTYLKSSPLTVLCTCCPLRPWVQYTVAADTSITCLSISPDGALLAAATREGEVVVLSAPALRDDTAPARCSFKAHDSYILQCSFSHDGKYPGEESPQSVVAWLVGWLAGWLIGWLIDWLVGWLIGWLIDWLIGWLVDWLIDWLVGWLIGWLIDWLID